jgi:aryl-alcohol dehydrogenase-like predicted oxidoreductase
VMTDQMPVLTALQRKGKVRHLGSSEQTRSDGAHSWLRAILPTNLLDVAMVGHNMFNQSAQRTVFPICEERDIGVVNVFTVRRLFSEPARLTEVTRDLQARGIVDGSLDPERPLDWLLGDGKAANLIEAAYRYALFTPGVTAVMTGTIDIDQLRQNIALVDKGPLPSEDLERLSTLFEAVDEPMGN